MWNLKPKQNKRNEQTKQNRNKLMDTERNYWLPEGKGVEDD